MDITRKIAYPIALALTLFLHACESTSPSGLSTRSLSKEAEAGQGYMLFSFSFQGKPDIETETRIVDRFDGYAFKIRGISDPYFETVVGLNANISSGYYRDFDVTDGMGFIFAEPLPAGDYEIYSYELTQYNWGPYTAITPSVAASIPFKVTEGYATYLGRIECHHKYESFETDWRNTIAPTNATFTSSDQLADDRNHAYSKFPHLLSVDIISAPIGREIDSLNGPSLKSKY